MNDFMYQLREKYRDYGNIPVSVVLDDKPRKEYEIRGLEQKEDTAILTTVPEAECERMGLKELVDLMNCERDIYHVCFRIGCSVLVPTMFVIHYSPEIRKIKLKLFCSNMMPDLSKK